MKVRIVANFEDRIREEMKRENVSRKKKACSKLKKDDEARKKWSLALYKHDATDLRDLH